MFVLSNIFQAIAVVLSIVINGYFWVVVISAILSWVRLDPYNPFVRTLRTLTEPVYYWVRKILPFTYTSGIDFSPVVVLLVLELLDRIVVKSLMQYAMTIA